MSAEENKKKIDSLSNSIVHLINHMRDVADGLYRHTYDIDMPIPQINKSVINIIEKTVNGLKGDIEVSEEVVSYMQDRDADIFLLKEYIEEKEEEMKDLKNRARGKSKYFKMFYNGITKNSPKE